MCDLSAVESRTSLGGSILSQNPFEMLSCEENGGTDLLSSDSRVESEWNTVVRDRKRQRVHTDDNKCAGSCEYEKLCTDDKLSVMFTEMAKIGLKVDQCLQVHQKVAELERQVSQHHSRLTLLEYKSLDMEARNRRNNIIFGGIPERKEENCHQTIANFLSDELGIDTCPPMPRVHRLGRYKWGSTRAIIANFLDSRDTEYVISRANRLKGTDFNINRDFPKEIVSARKMLWPEYKRLRTIFPDSKISIVYPAKLVKDNITVADMFPNWKPFLQNDRVTLNKPVFTNIGIPTDQHDSRAPRNVYPRENITNPSDPNTEISKSVTHLGKERSSTECASVTVPQENTVDPLQANRPDRPPSASDTKTQRSNIASTSRTSHSYRSRQQSPSPRPPRSRAPSRHRPAVQPDPHRAPAANDARITDTAIRRPWDTTATPQPRQSSATH